MPPRIQPHRLSQPSTCQCFRTRPAPPTERSFHASSRRDERERRKGAAPSKQTLLRRNMFAWLDGPGKAFQSPLKGSTNYLSAYDRQGNLRRAKRAGRDSPNDAEARAQDKKNGLDEEEMESRAEARAADQAELEERGGIPKEGLSDMHPYPLNQAFRSQPVLPEEMRESIWYQIARKGADVEIVSAAYGVDMRRVAAVVRMKTIEKQWVAEGKSLAKPYSEAVLAMLPKTPFDANKRSIRAHESINDLTVHPATRQQLFYPTSESRQFNRADAAKAFSSTLLPADKRIPHQNLLQIERWNVDPTIDMDQNKAMTRKMLDAQAVEKAAAEQKRLEWEARTKKTVQGRRWDFTFQDISADEVGKDGRSRKGVGYRYGMPHTDRKRGEVKIPTSVE